MSDDTTGNDHQPDALAPQGDDRPRVHKSDAAFRTISEVAEELNVPQHVLRFWETKFSHVRPLKRGGGRRYYRPDDVMLLKRIRALRYTDGMTIRGVQKLLRESPAQTHGVDESPAAPSPPQPGAADGVPSADVRRLLAELTALRDDLRAALHAA